MHGIVLAGRIRGHQPARRARGEPGPGRGRGGGESRPAAGGRRHGWTRRRRTRRAGHAEGGRGRLLAHAATAVRSAGLSAPDARARARRGGEARRAAAARAAAARHLCRVPHPAARQLVGARRRQPPVSRAARRADGAQPRPQSRGAAAARGAHQRRTGADPPDAQLRRMLPRRGSDPARHAEGSVLVEFGDTQVLCTASVEDTVPQFLRGKAQGWISAEYGMLPRATHTRTAREAARGRQSGRTQEIQRLIGRSLRAVVDLKALGDRTITIDCDVLQADGGTRTASVTGGFVALAEACEQLVQRRLIAASPLHGQVAAVSVGIVAGAPVLDLDYAEDSQAETDMNGVMKNGGAVVEIQGAAQGHALPRPELDALLNLAAPRIRELFARQGPARQRTGES